MGGKAILAVNVEKIWLLNQWLLKLVYIVVQIPKGSKEQSQKQKENCLLLTEMNLLVLRPTEAGTFQIEFYGKWWNPSRIRKTAKAVVIVTPGNVRWWFPTQIDPALLQQTLQQGLLSQPLSVDTSLVSHSANQLMSTSDPSVSANVVIHPLTSLSLQPPTISSPQVSMAGLPEQDVTGKS